MSSRFTHPQSALDTLHHAIHEHFLLILVLAHGVGLLLPGPGQALRNVDLFTVPWWGHHHLDVTMPVVLLGVLLFNAGLGIEVSELQKISAKPFSLLLGLMGNILTPLLFGVCTFLFGVFWHNPHEIQNIMVGLAILASMPIAGSSTAWAQNGNGNLSLSLGLVVFSTILSPLTTPYILKSFGWMTTGEYSEALRTLAHGGTGAFLGISVVIPSLLGILTRFLLKASQLEFIRPYFKLLTTLSLLMLIYSNAAIALPQAFQHPDWDFLALILLITLMLCVSAFTVGWLISYFTQSSSGDRTSLMFGLGMNNNGTGLVLSSMALAQFPAVMLPIIFYNLIQQLLAGVVDKMFCREVT